MKSSALLIALLLSSIPGPLSAQTPEWKTLSNRAGWSIQYPADWLASSCHACEDLTDPSLDVANFDPPRSEGGTVTLEIAMRPDSGSVNQLFEMLKAPNSRDAYILEERQTTVGGFPALRVVYSSPAKTPGKGLQHEIMFIVGRHRIFSIGIFSPLKIHIDDPIVPIRQLKNYSIYQTMVRLFRAE